MTTFHGLGLRILREHHEAAGLSPGFTVADEAVALQVAAELAGPRTGARCWAARTAAARAGASGTWSTSTAWWSWPPPLLRDDPAAAARLRARWPRISVDEYQDIDPAQYELLRLISGDGTGLTAIGDPDQAIYRFRGADVGIFVPVRRRLPRRHHGGADQELPLQPRHRDRRHAGHRAGHAGPGPDRGRRPGRPGGVVTLDEAADEHAEAAWIAATVDQLLGGTSFHSLDSGRADGHEHGKLGLADIAVLYRTDAQAGALAQALTRAGLPFQKRSHDLLARRPGVADVVREMRLAAGGDVAGLVTAAVRGIAAARGERGRHRDRRAGGRRAAAAAGPPLRRRPGAGSSARSRWAPRPTRWTRGPRRSRC